MFPLVRFQQRLVSLSAGCLIRSGGSRCGRGRSGTFGEADFAGEVFERDHLVRLHRALQLQDVFDQFVDQRPRALVADHGDPVDFGDVTASPVECSETLPFR